MIPVGCGLIARCRPLFTLAYAIKLPDSQPEAFILCKQLQDLGVKGLFRRGVGLGVTLFYELLDPGLQYLGPRLGLFVFWNVVFIV